MGLYNKGLNLFWYEKHGRIYEYSVPFGFEPRDNDLISDRLLNEFKLLREFDAHQFYQNYDRLNGDVELYVEEHDAQTMADADAAAIRKFNEANSSLT